MFPSPTQKTHSAGYAAISPSRPELSTKGKNVLVTGGAAGIGRFIAEGLAESGASSIGLVRRTASTLEAARRDLSASYPSTRFFTYAADVADLAAVTAALASFADDARGKVHVLVSNAGHSPGWKTLADADPADFWAAYEANVRGAFNLTRAVAPVMAAELTVVHVTTAAALVPFVPCSAAYSTSKLAAAKLWEYFGHENPGATVVGFHPGVHDETAMGVKAVAQGVTLPGDEASLPKGLAVWLASPEAKFLNGKCILASFDVEELKAGAAKIEGTMKFTVGMKGFPDIEAL